MVHIFMPVVSHAKCHGGWSVVGFYLGLIYNSVLLLGMITQTHVLPKHFREHAWVLIIISSIIKILLCVLKLVLIYIVGSHNICIEGCWVVLKCTSPEILLFLVWKWNWICLNIALQNNTSNFVHSINWKQILL